MSTNIGTRLDAKPVTMAPDGAGIRNRWSSNPNQYVPLSVFFMGIPDADADPDSLFGFRMPDRKKSASPKEKKSRGGSTGGKDEKQKDDDEDDDKGKSSDKGGSGPERAQSAKPRPAQSSQSQSTRGGAPAAPVTKQETKGTMSDGLARLLGLVNGGQSVAHLNEGKLLQPQKCKWCDEPASKAVIHSNAYAYVPVCAGHLNKAKEAVKSEYCYTSQIPQKGEKCELCDMTASYVVSASTFNSKRRTTGRMVRACCQKHLKRVRGEVNNSSRTSRHTEPTVERLSTTEMTTTANVPTLPVPIGAGDGRKFLDRPDDDKQKKKKKRRSLSRGLYVLLRQ
jgi:hypothetical protein